MTPAYSANGGAAPPSELAVLVNGIVVGEPIALIEAKQTMMIIASMIAYSTAVAPVSSARKRRIFVVSAWGSPSSANVVR